MAALEPRKGMPSPRLEEAEFRDRFLSAYLDPAFDKVRGELDRIAAVAWDGYANSRKSPVTQKAGPRYADPNYDLAVDWIEAKARIETAQAQHEDKTGPTRFLLINASSRSEHTCPGEMSKSYRLLEIAREVLDTTSGVEVEVLELNRLASEYGREIHPCKACFSTAAALCHWPCSCYPNYSLGQTNDWMNDIYPMWVRAHGIMIVTPVNWYQVSSPLKLMMDRLVCADGGNPDPTLTHGKDAEKAKAEELKGWGLSAPSGWPPVRRRGPWRRRRRRGRPAQPARLALVDAVAVGRRPSRARPLHRLLEALRHQPPRARRRPGGAGRGADRRPHSLGSRASQAGWPAGRGGREPHAAAAEIAFSRR
jgi:multimeric flavodoxin WrbA